MRRVAAACRRLEAALDDHHTEELEVAVYVQAPVHQQNALTFLAIDGRVRTGNVNDREVAAAGTRRVGRAAPVGEHGRVAAAAARHRWGDGFFGEVLRR